MSSAAPQTIALGDATITIINVGDMMVDMAQEIGVPESAWRFKSSRPHHSKLLPRRRNVWVIRTFLVATGRQAAHAAKTMPGQRSRRLVFT